MTRNIHGKHGDVEQHEAGKTHESKAEMGRVEA